MNSSVDIRANSSTTGGIRTATNTIMREKGHNDSTISNTISNVMTVTIKDKTLTIDNDNEKDTKMQKMLDKQLPITLHRFRHLMSNGK